MNPNGRASFGLCYGNKHVYIFGGSKTTNNDNEYSCLNDLWCYTGMIICLLIHIEFLL